MALQINYNSDQFGILANGAYAKIDSFRGNISRVTFDVSYYVSQEARLEGKSPIGTFIFSVPYSDSMTYASVYNYLKTLPEFSGALDV
jgi:hypothetical protein